MNESEADRGSPLLPEAATDRDVPPWMIVNERIPWPGFTQEQWDRLLVLRQRIRTGHVTEDGAGSG